MNRRVVFVSSELAPLSVPKGEGEEEDEEEEEEESI